MNTKDIQVLAESYKKIAQIKEELSASQITHPSDLKNYIIGWLQGILKGKYTTVKEYERDIQRILEFLSK